MSKITRSGYEPVAAYVARLALRQYFFRGKPLFHGELVKILNKARKDLGLSEYQGGAASDYIQKKVVDGYNHEREKNKNKKQPWIKKEGKGNYKITLNWTDAWRFLFAPGRNRYRGIFVWDKNA